MGQAILVLGIGVGDVGLGFLELGLAEFDDRAETKIVAGLRQIKSEAGLFAELLSDRKALESTVGILPGNSHVTCDVVAKVG